MIHGDYDVDGVCSTAVLGAGAARLGADPVCELPSRFDEGYGLSRAGVERLAAAGTDLLVTVDCGITAVDEVAHARALGIDVVVTDHHRPGERLPDCPSCTRRSAATRSPSCAPPASPTSSPRRSPDAGDLDTARVEEDLDLVALATVCDVVPLVGENRRLVRDGLVRRSRARASPGCAR